jgi:hypothetical protein
VRPVTQFSFLIPRSIYLGTVPWKALSRLFQNFVGPPIISTASRS